jgi:hypothetical protein
VQTLKSYKKYDAIANLEDAQNKILNENIQLKKQHDDLTSRIKSDSELLDSIKLKINEATGEYEKQIEVIDSGFYKMQYNFSGSESYKAKLDQIRAMQKDMLKEKTASIVSSAFTFNGSASKGKAMTDKVVKLSLRSFNGECDTLTYEVSYKNINSFVEKIKKSYEQINKLTEFYSVKITPEYLDLKLQQLKLTHEYQQKKQIEKEEQRALKEQLREEEKARIEIEKALADAEKDERKYREALEKAKKEMESAADKEKALAIIERLQNSLNEALARLERTKSMAQMTKSGYVYIISNIGSFGENVYKIGMTRRLEPMDRVSELGDASVPFSFDVHGMIFSENAPELENKLHKIFEKNRINKVNNKKEFFMMPIEQIEMALIENGVHIDLIKIPEAEQYFQTIQIDKEFFGLS